VIKAHLDLHEVNKSDNMTVNEKDNLRAEIKRDTEKFVKRHTHNWNPSEEVDA